jgi:hypothetical protein
MKPTASRSNAPCSAPANLSLLHVAGEWQWLVRCDGRDVAEGAARSADDAQRQAEVAAHGQQPFAFAAAEIT